MDEVVAVLDELLWPPAAVPVLVDMTVIADGAVLVELALTALMELIVDAPVAVDMTLMLMLDGAGPERMLML
jgi:hypothetical protein